MNRNAETTKQRPYHVNHIMGDPNVGSIGSGSVGSLASAQCNAIPARNEPATLQRAGELRGYVCELEQVADQLQTHLFGPSDTARPPEPIVDGLDSCIADTCQRAANLVGYLRTINNRLGG